MWAGAPLLASRWWQLQNAWRVRPLQHVVAAALWSSLFVVVPVLLRSTRAEDARAVLHFIVSLDIPLVLAFAGVVAGVLLPKLAATVRRDADQWLLPARYRGWSRSLNFIGPLGRTLIWPFGAIAACIILAWANAGARADCLETLLLGGVGMVIGCSLAGVVAVGMQQAAAAKPAWRNPGSGMALLSWAPFTVTLETLRPRRLALLAVPVMLAAPMNSAVPGIAMAVVVWWAVMCCVILVRTAATVTAQIRSWTPEQQMPVHVIATYAFRYVAVFFVALGFALGGATRAFDAWRAAR